jgi:Trypsin-like peptidase domain
MNHTTPTAFALFLFKFTLAVLAMVSWSAEALASPYDLVKDSLVYLKVEFTATKLQVGVPMTDQSTGFLISSDGFILTSYHLLEKVREYAGDNVKVTAVVGDGAQPVTAAIVNGLQPVDLLLIKIRAVHPFQNFLKLGRAAELTLDDTIYTSGFHDTEPFNSQGTVNNKVGPAGLGYLWTVNMSVAAGQSGSPVYLANGTVVGILKGENSGASNVGYMVPIEFADSLIAFLRFRELEERLAAEEKEIGPSTPDQPLAPRLTKVESSLQDVSSNFEWHAEEKAGQIILTYHKLVSGSPQVKTIKYNVVPLVTENETRLTSRDRPLVKDDGEVSVNKDNRGGKVIIPKIGELIDLRLQSTPGTTVARLEITIASILDDGNVLDPVSIPIDIEVRPR